MVPASNVSVPPVVVIRTKFNVPDKATDPLDNVITALSVLAALLLATQVFPVIFEITICPVNTAALAIDWLTGNPAVDPLVVLTVDEPIVLTEVVYPDVVGLPETPNCTITA